MVLEKQVEANAAHQEEREEDLERLGDEARLFDALRSSAQVNALKERTAKAKELLRHLRLRRGMECSGITRSSRK